MPSPRSLLLNTSFFLLIGTLAAQTSNPAKLPSRPTPPPVVTESANKEPKVDKPADYSQEAVVVEKLRREFRFENDGTGSSTVTARIKVQTQAGVQQLGQLVWGYNSANEKMDVVYVRVGQPDGSGVVTAGSENAQDVPLPIERDAPSYSDYRERHVTVPALRPGQVLEYRVKTTTFSPLIPKNFWFEHIFRKDVITLDEQIEINIPKDRKIKLKTKPEFPPKIEEQGDRKIYRWTSTYLKRESDDELKKKERKQAKEDFYPDIALTTFQNWEELGNWYSGLQKSQIEPTPALKAKAEELTKDAKTDEEKMQAVYDFVAQEYRYVSLSFGLGRYQPHAAGEVLDKKYGDCKDKHTLFSAMLKTIGFTVQPVLIGSQRKLDPEMPSPAQFDHVFSAIMPPKGSSTEKAGGKAEPMLWADTTTEIAPFGLLSYNIRKKQALLVGLDGPSRLIETPPNPPFQSAQDFTVEGAVTDLGKLKGTVKGTFRGDYELALRMVFRSVAENKWKDVAKYISYQAGIGGDVETVKIQNLNNTHVPLSIEFDITRPNFFDWANKSTDLQLPLPQVPLMAAGNMPDDDETDPAAAIAAADDKDDDDDATDAKTTKKSEEKPIELGAPLDLKLHLKLQLPASYKSRTPVPVNVKRDYAEYKSTYKVDGDKLSVERAMTVRMREIPAERRTDYAAFVRSVRTDEKQKFHIETANVATGAPELPKDIKVDELIDSARDAMQSQNYRVALDLLKRASEKEPKRKQIWNMLGDAQMGLRQFKDAEAAFRKQLTTDAFDPFAHNNLGRALWLQDRRDDAVGEFQKQLEVNPLDKDALASLGELYYELKRYQESADVTEKAVSLDPDNGFLQSNLGRAYLNLKREKEAIEVFDKAVELQPNPMLWNNIAYEIADSDSSSNLDRAQQYAESAVSQVTSSLRNISVDRLTMRDMGSVMALGSYWDTLGWVAFKKGDVEKAERYIYSAWNLTQSGEAGDHLARIYQKKGRNDEAAKLFAQALSANRPKVETRERLTKLVGEKAKLDKLIADQKAELSKERTFKLGKLTGSKSSADFFVMLVPGGPVEAVKFISGSAELKPFAAKVQALDYGKVFPDDAPTKVVRRGVLNCEASGECSFVLMDPETITSIN